MKNTSDDLEKIATGTLVDMNLLKDELESAGIFGRIVGDDLATGLGSTLPGSVELWVRLADAAHAATIMQRDAEHPQTQHGSHKKFPHPESGHKPDKTQGPHHSPQPHRPSP
jgi:hypothetical protein